MTSNLLNWLIVLVGLTLLLTGLVFHEAAVAATSLAGVGGSVLATGIVNLVLTYRKETLPWLQPIERFAQQLDFMRTNHTAEIRLEVGGDDVIVKKTHRFALRNPYPWPRKRRIRLGTDASCAPAGGFLCVTEPDGTILEGDHLQQYIVQPPKDTMQGGEYAFEKTYRIQPGDSNTFQFESRETYRSRDRLIWTVQDFCDDFKVKIYSPDGDIRLKINHHYESEILAQCEEVRVEKAMVLDFSCEVFPYQGFEVAWNFGHDDPSENGPNV